MDRTTSMTELGNATELGDVSNLTRGFTFGILREGGAPPDNFTLWPWD